MIAVPLATLAVLAFVAVCALVAWLVNSIRDLASRDLVEPGGVAPRPAEPPEGA